MTITNILCIFVWPVLRALNSPRSTRLEGKTGLQRLRAFLGGRAQTAVRSE